MMSAIWFLSGCLSALIKEVVACGGLNYSTSWVDFEGSAERTLLFYLEGNSRFSILTQRSQPEANKLQKSKRKP